ncbi:MAG TPA: D-glycero-beta-D-manno-heptose 1-phosphate adenylyltransferase [Chitinophagaceae bacterium]|nr:D-glycero-beta-D-manno-heptose 1-phosphate adenylyltransferase [Chitinophagaceae bacterium]MCC6634313.1 D-glycero-beta-D-manno-heptose 1-phosphate adenylyltransferase [Chitinophagaceae bacterium]HMZ46329.1 D-glycero-beta-D-manno-heptose 1-phosphate adenylyltransferase [Chitinophagaceae bacterium]HNE93391.1 D-glycero-beta-D-manno-heptose 1-phosphate adenylyltransferase [Chitinophagaceae bacterium]HNF30550.1 D-glycero-beta-D-manno-heptose 1-phosphate adenylyltransferase [Chitinophagaceae bacte
MKQIAAIEKKIFDLPALVKQVAIWKKFNKTIAFTNGCFDILHDGHIYSLSQAAKEADYLIVAVNSDSSIKKIKGEDRPINHQQSRAMMLASFAIIDAVIIFEEDTPYNLITTLLPNVLVKGGDYTINQIIGAEEVIKNGGNVVINPIIQGFSTTGIINKIKNL